MRNKLNWLLGSVPEEGIATDVSCQALPRAEGRLPHLHNAIMIKEGP